MNQYPGLLMLTFCHCKQFLYFLIRGGGQSVSVLTFYSYDPSLNPAEVFIFYIVNISTETMYLGIGFWNW